MNEWTSLRRMLTALDLERPDRVPVFLNNALSTSRVIGVKIGDLVRNPELFCDALCTSYEKYGYDGVRITSDVTVEAEAMGGHAIYPADSPVVLREHPIKSREDFLKLALPDPYNDGRMPIMLKLTELVRQRVGADVFISSSVMGPMNMASQLTGVSELLELTVEEPEYVEELLDFTSEVTLLYGKALHKAGANCITMGEALCSCSTLGPRHYAELVQKKHKYVVDEFNKAGIHYQTLHICGKIAPILLDVANTGVNSIDIDTPVNIPESRAVMGHRVAMVGNISPNKLLTSPASRITELCREVLSHKDGMGLVLGSGCNVAADTPEENIRAMVDAVKAFGRYE